MLVVKPHDRFDVHKTLSHRYLANSTVKQDLRDLETRLNLTIANWEPEL